MLQSESLVLELATVDTLPTPSVPSGEVSTLPYYLVKKRFIKEETSCYTIRVRTVTKKRQGLQENFFCLIPGKLCMATHLQHELWNNTVELAALVVKRCVSAANSLLAGAQGSEVLGSARNDIRPECELDAACRAASDSNIEEDFR